MTSREFRERLLRRARRANTAVDADWIEPLEKYFDLLARWNAKINLTALPLQEPTDATFDRLFIEPLAAARYVANQSDSWCDLGSGGGSPAIPLKISRPLLKLTMIEAKARKAAFLSEAVRILALPNAGVINKRFDELTDSDAGLGSYEPGNRPGRSRRPETVQRLGKIVEAWWASAALSTYAIGPISADGFGLRRYSCVDGCAAELPQHASRECFTWNKAVDRVIGSPYAQRGDGK